MRFCWVKFNARNNFLLAKIVFLKRSWTSSSSDASLASSNSFIVAKHLKIVLKHINQLIALQSFLNLRRDFVDKFIQSICRVNLTSLLNFLVLVQEICWLVLCTIVHHAVKICL